MSAIDLPRSSRSLQRRILTVGVTSVALLAACGGSDESSADGVSFYDEIAINTGGDGDGDGDGTPDTAASVTLEFGTDDAYDDGADDEPSDEATVLLAGDLLTTEEFTWDFRDDGQLFGSGEITDDHGVGTAFGEYTSLDCSAACL